MQKNLRSRWPVAGLLSAAWCTFVIVGPICDDVSLKARLLFAFLSAVTSLAILSQFGYFSSLRLRPQLSNVLSILVAVPMAALAQCYVFNKIIDVEFCSVESCLAVAGCVAISTFFLDYLWESCSIKFFGKKKIVLDVLPEEKQRLIDCFNAHSLSDYVEFLSCNDLRKNLLSKDTAGISMIVISRKTVSSFDVDGLLVRAHLAGIPIVDINNLEVELNGYVPLENTDQWSYILEATEQTSFLKVLYRVKLLLEPVLALAMLITLAPLMILVAFLIKRSSPGPVFYKQTRTGYLGRPFTLIKFRSMRIDAEANGPQWSVGAEDDRVTPIGKFIRRTRIDELPQLINVIRGEMSFCGPRPERPEMYAKLKNKIPLFALRTLVRPGITGWAQVRAGYAASVEESKIKLEHDLFYIKRMTPRLDLVILVKTVLVALFGDRSKAEVIPLEVASPIANVAGEN